MHQHAVIQELSLQFWYLQVLVERAGAWKLGCLGFSYVCHCENLGKLPTLPDLQFSCL